MSRPRSPTPTSSSSSRGGLLRADDQRRVRGWNVGEEGEWREEFFFMQMADTQIGMAESLKPINPETGELAFSLSDEALEAEIETVEKAVMQINRLKPAFVVVCGDMTDEAPAPAPTPAPATSTSTGTGTLGTDTRDTRRKQQIDRCKGILKQIDATIPLLCCCGNHDVGNRPNFHSLKKYKEAWGNDYFSFWVQGTYCIVLNSQLYADSSECAEEARKQRHWISKTLEDFKSKYRPRANNLGGNNSPSGPKRRKINHNEKLPLSLEGDNIDEEGGPSCEPVDECLQRCMPVSGPPLVAFSHISPFIGSVSEPDAYFNWKKSERIPMLESLYSAGCRGWMCGHFHRNSEGMYKDMQVVTTGACGVNILTSKTGNYLDVSGVGQGVLSDDASGLRIVKVLKTGHIQHVWQSINQLRSLKTMNDALVISKEKEIS